MLSAPQNSAECTDLVLNLAAVRARIMAAAVAASRSVDSITLLAVSKGNSAERIRAAAGLGLRQFGESYAAEALPKIAALRPESLEWHFIGRLQANKTRPVAEHFDWVHGVDRLRVAERLSAQRPVLLAPLNVCLQVNVLGEASKGGVTAAQLPALLDGVRALPRLQLRGLMCILPHDADHGQQLAGFGLLRDLRDSVRDAQLPLATLSMGMSGDLEAAVAAGTTLLRIGTALFGEREPLLAAPRVE